MNFISIAIARPCTQLFSKLSAKLSITLLLLFNLVACGSGDTSLKKVTGDTQTLNKVVATGYTYQSEDGNRLVAGQADIQNLTPIDIPLSGTSRWLVSVAIDGGSIWATVLEDGTVKAFKISNNQYENIEIAPNKISAAAPPTLIVEEDGSVKLANVLNQTSTVSNTTVLNENGDRVFIGLNGDLVLNRNGTESRLSVNALPYARILLDENKRLLLLSSPTSRYGHRAVLGNNYDHAAAIRLVATEPEFKLLNTISLIAPDVIEGNALIWADVDNDSKREIITTVSQTGLGARIVIYNEDGSLYSESTSIGINNRWRHQIAVANMRGNATADLVSIYIPHLGPVLEFFQLEDASSSITNQAVSYSSHLFTSPNIDMSLVGNFDADEQLEIMLVDRNNRQRIGAFEYINNISLDWTLTLSSPITSNASAVALTNGQTAYGVGQGKQLRIWHP